MDLSWKYSTGHSPPAPVVSLKLAGVPVDCMVDTGFSGSLLIPFSLFQSLGLLARLTPNSYRVVMSDSRRLLLFTAEEEVSIGTLRMRAEVHSCRPVEKRLIGRTLLRSFLTTLDGRNERLTLSRG